MAYLQSRRYFKTSQRSARRGDGERRFHQSDGCCLHLECLPLGPQVRFTSGVLALMSFLISDCLPALTTIFLSDIIVSLGGSDLRCVPMPSFHEC